MNNYQLIAIDMDGTLLKEDKTISPRTTEAIATAVASGKYVVISSGRSVDELRDYEKEIAGIPYYVLENGALVYDAINEKPLHTDSLTLEQAHHIFDLSQTEDVMLYYDSFGKTVVDADKMPIIDKYGMETYKDVYERYHTLVSDVPSYYYAHAGSLEKVIYFCATPKIREKLYAQLKDYPVAFAFTEEKSLEISPSGVNKATGLGHLCDILGITLEECIAVGDSGNDIAMLKAVGLPIAMGNSTDEVLALCDVVVADNEHDGVAEAIETYLL